MRMKKRKNNLNKLIQKSVRETLNNLWHEDKVKKVLNNEPLNEMSRINLKETGKLFPSNKFHIWIWSNDHNPPHFHVDYPQEQYECSFLIDTGELLEVKGDSDNCTIHNKVLRDVKKWLNNPCAINPKISNKENAILTWMQNHEYDF